MTSMCIYIQSLSKFSSTDNRKSYRNFYETEIIAIACLKIVHTVYARFTQEMQRSFELLCNISLYFYIIIRSKTLISKVTFSAKIELVIKAYTKIPCVNTEKPMLVHKIISPNQNKIVVNGRHWLALKIMCGLKGICA